jgi:hypothetical protein
MIGLGHLRGLGSGGSFAPAAVLDFDFLSGRIDSRLMYTRGSLASRIDGAGRLAVSPHNLCLYSEQFTVGWLREGISAFGAGSVAGSETGPDGAVSADVIDEGDSGGRHIVYQVRPIPGDGCYAGSVFVKDSGRRFVQLLVIAPGYVAGGFVIADLVNGVLTQTRTFTINAPVVSSSIEPAGDGWFRISICFKVLPGASFVYFIVAASDRPNDARGTMLHASPTYAGTGKKLALWGAQLEYISQGSSVRSYVRSQAVPFHAPRLDHDPARAVPLGLLVEESRTNLIVRSEAPSSQIVSVVAEPYTISFYGLGSIALSGVASAIVSGVGAYPSRRSFSFVPSSGALSLGVSGDVKFAQCERGSFATSWIPTWDTASFRGADDVRVDAANMAGWLSRSAGTFLLDGSRFTTSSRGDLLHLRNSTNSALGEVNAFGGAGGTFDISMRKTAGAFTTSLQGAFSSSSSARVALAYGADFGSVSINGSSPVSSSGVLELSQIDAMTIGSNAGANRSFLNGHVRRIRHYGRRLSDALLQRLSA